MDKTMYCKSLFKQEHLYSNKKRILILSYFPGGINIAVMVPKESAWIQKHRFHNKDAH